MKNILEVASGSPAHWVGNGFPVRSLFSYHRHARAVDPFLLLDYAGPAQFEPTAGRRGVGEHPHRGFETVTIVYQGEVSHRDTAGNSGTIGPGDVQWMTAGSGILHEEYHSEHFARAGGTLEMVQLWVNLPASSKMTDPGYQAILNAEIPAADLPDSAGKLRVIAGDYEGLRGPAHTHTAMQVWDLQLVPGGQTSLRLPDGWGAGLVVLEGTVQVNDTVIARKAQAVLLDRVGREVRVQSNNNTRLLLLSGAPIDEPVVGYGPFVMNSEAEIHQAISDLQQGRFGLMGPTTFTPDRRAS